MNVRPETPADYAAIAALHVRAFGERAAEALIVALHRHRAAFDPALSLVAAESGRIVGHALFSPQSIRLLGQAAPAVNLAPIAVDPALQGRGVGGRLIAAGHEVARARGYSLCFLLGHPSYYPRFGYQTHAYGGSSLAVAASGLAGEGLAARPPAEADLPALRELWLREEANVDFAIEPGPDLLDWLSPNPPIAATVWLRGDALAGYTRVHAAEPARPRVFLAVDQPAAHGMAAAIARSAGLTELILPLHPFSTSAAAFGEPRAASWEPAMACPLAPGPYDEYRAQVRAGHRPPGRPSWPVAFDLG
jgi:predicted N-acetyltransferase YhbS